MAKSLLLASSVVLLLLSGGVSIAQQAPPVDRDLALAIRNATRCNLATTYKLGPAEHVNVHRRPDPRSRIVGRLAEGRIVYVCDEDGKWLNIYYGDETPCFRTYEEGLVFAEARRCHSGWVDPRWVNILSG